MRFAAFAVMYLAAAPAFAGTDPYLWLEQVHGARAQAWVAGQNATTLHRLEADPHYAGFYAQALALGQAADRIPTPAFTQGDITNLWQDAAHVQGIWRRTSLAGYAQAAPPWSTVLDVDALSRAEHKTWVWEGADCLPPAETRCLVSLSNGGEDAVTTRELSFPAGAFTAGGFTIPRAKQVVEWETANSLIVGTDWGPGSMTASGYPFVIKRLARGQPLSAAAEIFRGPPSDVAVEVQGVTDGQGHHAVILIRGIDFFHNEFYVVTPGSVQHLSLPQKVEVEGLLNNNLIVKLNEQAGPIPSGSLAALNLATPSAPLTLIFAPSPTQAIDQVAVTAHTVVAAILDNVRGRALVFTPGAAGYTARTLALPDNAAIDLTAASFRNDNLFLEVTSFLTPTTLYLADTGSTAAPVIEKALPAQFDASADKVDQFEATSKDGTKIPYFIVHPADMKLDGKNPTILYGYGGFQVSMTPTYSPTLGKLWLNHGGVFVLANIRGGGEFGPAWHEAALKTHRQVAFDDFAAVGEDLIARHITDPRHLGIRGGSNGGLLMGVEFEQHPDLWHAAMIEVPLLDMIRFEQIEAGASWVGEYGSNAVPAEHAFLESISPYQNLREGVHYPTPFLFTTTKDDRVGPEHARKFAAKLAALHDPYFFYESAEGGHGAGANQKEKAQEAALEYTYLAKELME